MKTKRAIFLDRDGVINQNRPDNVRTWDHFIFEDGALDALARLGASDYIVLVITNQSGIGRGHMTQETVEEIHARMGAHVASVGGRISRTYYCPHQPAESCTCRKPSPEMVLRGRDEFNLDLRQSYFIGDWIDDVRAARAAGVTPLLVRTGRGEKAIAEMQALGMPLPPVLDNLSAAVDWILQQEYSAEQV